MKITGELLNSINLNPLYSTLGIYVEQAGEGGARTRLEPGEKLRWPFPGQPHGGILFTAMDVTMAWAVFSQLEPGQNCATIHMDIQYTRPARGASFACVAATTHRAGRLSFVKAELHDSEEQLVAIAQATFRIVESDVMT